MSCADITPRLELMADDELTSEQAAQTLAHISDCQSCSNQWYSLLDLRKVIKEKAAKFEPSAGFEDRLLAAVRAEGQNEAPVDINNRPDNKISNKVGNKTDRIYSNKTRPANLAIAAAVLLIGVLGLASLNQSNTPKEEKITTATSFDSSKIAAASLAPASLEDAINNFEHYLGGEKHHDMPDKTVLARLSKEAGFEIKAMPLDGFKICSAQMVSAADGKCPLVRLCYRRTKGKQSDSVVCYQAASGKLVAAGLNEHLIDGRKICCGEKEDKSIVYIPAAIAETNPQTPTVLLLGTISKSDLMDLVLSSS